MFEVLDLYRQYRRGRSEPAELCATVEALGGEVIEHRMVSRIKRSPFNGLRTFPMLYEIRANHGQRRGLWYARTSADGGPPDWAWQDLDGYEGLPVEFPSAVAVGEVEPVGWFADSIIVGGMILLGAGICLAIMLAVG